MALATSREFSNDANGVRRLAAAVGDTSGTAAITPASATPGPATYTSPVALNYISRTVPAVGTAGNDATHVVGEVKRPGVVSSVSYMPDAAITGAATNNRRLRLVNKGQDGTGTTIVAELQFTNGTNIAAGDEGQLTLSATPANLVVAASDVLGWESTHIGTGIADPGGVAQAEIAYNA